MFCTSAPVVCVSFIPHYAKVGPYVTVMFVLYEEINKGLNWIQA